MMPTVHGPKPQSLSSQSKDVVAAVVASDGSVLNTAARSATRLGDMVQRGAELFQNVRRRSDERLAEQKAKKQERTRRLSESQVSSFYDQVEERLRLKLEARQAKHPARKLSVADVGLTTPDTHIKEHGWVSELIDWKELFQEMRNAASVLLKRHDHVLDHVEQSGYLPNGELRDEHKTGISILDINAPPSRLGNKLRQLHAFISGTHKTGEHRENHRRRMQTAAKAPRKQDQGQHQSMLGSIIEAGVVGADPVEAAIRSLENSNHHRESTARRLADSFLGTAASLPLAGSDTSNRYDYYQKTDGYNFFQDLLRYVIYDTVSALQNTHLASRQPT